MEKQTVAVFHDEDEAIKAIDDLKNQGYTADEISVIAKNSDDFSRINEETGTKAPEGMAAGAATGGVVGGVTGLLVSLGALAIPVVGPFLAAGPVVATLTGAAAGASAGGLVGGLIGVGLSEEEAHQYNEYVDEGYILVLVNSRPGRDRVPRDTSQRSNSLNACTFNDSCREEIEPNRVHRT
jgi:hypothetical protein